MCVIAEVMITNLDRPNSIVEEAVLSHVIDVEKKKFSYRTNREVIPYYLRATEMARLTETFPEIDCVFSPKGSHHPHALSAAVRKCEMRIALNHVNYYSGQSIPKGYHVAVKDVGGNFITHLKRGREDIHSCCPILDARDAQRFSSRCVDLTYMSLSDKKNLVEKFGDPVFRRKMVCIRPPQKCAVRAFSSIFLHSTYDVTLEDIADSLDSAGSMVGVVVTMFDPLILLRHQGKIDVQNCLV